MDTDRDAMNDRVNSLLYGRHVFDIDAYGWSNEDEVDQAFVGYAMWTLSPPYDHDFDAWQTNTPPRRAPTEQERHLMELGHDFFGLMKTAQHFIGYALIDQSAVPAVRVEPTPFDFAEFAALAALTSAADRLRDFFIIAILGRKTDERDQLDKAYSVLKARHLGDQADELRRSSSAVLGSLRTARNVVVHGLATQPARVQRHLMQMDKDAFEAQSWNKDDGRTQGYEETIRQARAAEAAELAAVERRAVLLCDCYRGLARIGSLTFEVEHDWRGKQRV